MERDNLGPEEKEGEDREEGEAKLVEEQVKVDLREDEDVPERRCSGGVEKGGGIP